MIHYSYFFLTSFSFESFVLLEDMKSSMLHRLEDSLENGGNAAGALVSEYLYCSVGLQNDGPVHYLGPHTVVMYIS